MTRAPTLGRSDAVWAALVSAASCALLAHRIGTSAELPAYLYFGVLTGPLTVIDCRTRRLPDVLTLPAYPAIISLLAVAAAVHHDTGPLLRALLAAAATIAFYLLLLLLRPGGLGLGDLKLAGAAALLGGWTGWAIVLVAPLLSFTAVVITGAALALVGRTSGRTSIPLGPFLVAGLLAAHAHS